jgi:CopG family nickel-responsive transcriptional regulator
VSDSIHRSKRSRPRRLEEISTFVGKIRATKDTLTVDYSVLPVDDFGPLADID